MQKFRSYSHRHDVEVKYSYGGDAMARDPRREYDGGIYHAIARGNNK
ncbi:MAG: hypothetical protein PHF82_10565 [Lutispora sp.]|nr:hypothetical protein [Lutispora sp.]